MTYIWILKSIKLSISSNIAPFKILTRFFSFWLLGLMLVAIPTGHISAHEIRPAYLEIKQIDQTNYEILWKIPVMDGRIPKISPILPDEFELTELNTQSLVNAQIKRYKGVYEDNLGGKEIQIDNLSLTLIDVLIQIELQNDLSYALMLQPKSPKVRIPVEPNRWSVAQLYLVLGIEHILLGIDHLLFVLGLFLLVIRFKPLLQTITAFTIAHSITLGLASLNYLSLPQAPVEAIIALSIVFLAKEYINWKNGKESLTARSPWLVAFSFGLLHGFGFAGALSEIGFPQKEVPLALFTFNLGVELGQILFLLVLWAGRSLLVRLLPHPPKWSFKVIPYLIGGLASFWLIERTLGMII